MSFRFPQAQPLANSQSRLAIVVRGAAGSKVYELSPRAAFGIAVLGALLLTWYLVATLYLVFRDDLANGLISGQTRMQHAYEDRIAALRMRIDKLTARQVINQDSIEGQVSDLLTRQAQLESRQALVTALAEQAVKRGMIIADIADAGTATKLPAAFAAGTGGPVEPLGEGNVRAFLPALPRTRPTPLPADAAPAPPSIEDVPLRRSGFDHPLPETVRSSSLAATLGNADSRLRLIETRQIGALRRIEDTARHRVSLARRAINATGLNAEVLVTKMPMPEGIGGPLLPMREAAGRNPFDVAAGETQAALAHADRFGQLLHRLPLRRPMPAEYELSSGFGPRLDPFTRSLAVHAGVDFRAPYGAPVRATAPGRVIDAGYRGGYGRMVEIEHDFGITTRYAHLSSIAVSEGDRVERGAVLGQVGSTGRSTGPHLHYEVRRDDEPADPMVFLRAAETMR